MTNALQQVGKLNAGLCPHGLPPGACPICSRSGGGESRVGERPQKAGEMSYHQCAMIGAMMKARQQRVDAHNKNLQLHSEAVLQFQQNLEKMAQKMIDFANRISNSFIFKPVAFTISNIVVGVNNGISKITSTTLNAISNLKEKLSQLKQKIFDIQDKLNAVFGEIKNFIEKRISELVSTAKKNFGSLFKIFKRENAKDEDTKIDDDKKIFNLKTILQKIKSKLKKDDTKDKSRS